MIYGKSYYFKEIFYLLTTFFGVFSALMGALMLQDALSGKNNVFLSLLVIISGFLAFSYQYVKEEVEKLKFIFWFGIAFVWFVGAVLLIVIVAVLFS